MDWIRQMTKDWDLSVWGLLFLFSGAAMLGLIVVGAAFTQGGFVAGICTIAVLSIVIGFFLLIST